MTNKEVINCLKTGFYMSGMDNEAISLAIQAIEDVGRLKAENKAYRTIISDYKRAEADEIINTAHARWKLWSNNKPIERRDYEYYCSACTHRQIGTSIYCPSCGAKMDAK